MSPRLQAISLVAGREIRERTRSRAFRLSTVLLMLIVLAAVIFPALANANKSTPVYIVGVVGSVDAQLQTSISELGSSVGGEVQILVLPDRDHAVRALDSSIVDLALIPREEILTHIALDPNTPTALSDLAVRVANVERMYSGLEKAGLSPEQSAAALNAPALPVRGLEAAPPRNSSDAQASSSGMILLFVFLTLHGAFILNGVIEEKTSRVVEILLSSVRPSDLLLGKVIGIGIVGSIQGVVLVAVTLVSRGIAPGGPTSSSLTPAVVGYSLMWFLIGFAVYAGLFACAGALVSRAEDAQNLVFPLQLPLIGSYVVGLTSALNGPNPVLNAMSFIPFTAPMTMLERMAAQQVELWEVLLSVSLSLITAVLIMKLAAVIFAGGILRSGQRVKLREAWKATS